MNGAAAGSTRIISGSPDGQVSSAVAVKISQGRQSASEAVFVCEARPSAQTTGDFLAALHRAIGVHQKDIDRAAVGPARVISVGSDGQVGNSVAIEVSQRGYRAA